MSDHAGNEQNYKIKYVLYNASDIKGLVDDIFNFPNPFRERTWITFQLSKSKNVILDIYNLNGVLIKQLENNYLLQGEYRYLFNAGDRNCKISVNMVAFKPMVDETSL